MSNDVEKYVRIYRVTNVINGKIYIGCTKKTLPSRMALHKYNTRNGSKLRFHNALRKYGFDNFKWEDILYCSREESHDYEIGIISLYRSNDESMGYNITKGGRGISGYKHTLETKEIMSNRNFTEETREKMRQNNLGKVMPDNVKKKIRESLSGERNYLYGFRKLEGEYDNIAKMMCIGISCVKIAKHYNVSRATVYNYKNEMEASYRK